MVQYRLLALLVSTLVLCLLPAKTVAQSTTAVATAPAERYAEYTPDVIFQILFDGVRNTFEYISSGFNFDLNTVVTYICRTPSNATLTPVYNSDPDLSTKLDASKNLTLVIHGFIDNQNRHWIGRMVRDLSDFTDANVCIVDWSKLSTIEYSIAVSNVNKVGAHIGEFLLSNKDTFPLDRVSIIGHSLGAHVGGAAGAQTGGQIDAIYGIDPAHPLITIPVRPPEERLDSTDAKYVQVLHTTSGTFGTPLNIGTADWHADNGKSPQKGCEPFIIIFTPDAFAPISIPCSHFRALEIFRFALNKANRFVPFSPLNGVDIYGWWSNRTAGVYYFPTKRDRPYV